MLSTVYGVSLIPKIELEWRDEWQFTYKGVMIQTGLNSGTISRKRMQQSINRLAVQCVTW